MMVWFEHNLPLILAERRRGEGIARTGGADFGDLA